MPCPCHSTIMYHKCCQPFHKGEPAPDALKLMRSRYAAYALGLSDYIMDTTHPDNPHYEADRNKWRSDLDQFAARSHFDGLRIREFSPDPNDPDRAEVTFTAHMRQDSQIAAMTEVSSFVRQKGRWLYRDGRFI